METPPRPRVLLVEPELSRSETHVLLQEHRYPLEVVDELRPPWDALQPCDIVVFGDTLSWSRMTEYRMRASRLRHHPLLMVIFESDAARAWRLLTSNLESYVTKPHTVSEFIIKLEHTARRSERLKLEPLLRIEDLTFDPNTQEVFRNGQPIRLTPVSRRILEILMREAHRYVSKEELEQRIWQDEETPPESVRPRIYQLRKAVDEPFPRKLIHTSRGMGYRIG